ncbi:MAG TPA: hypothetical protein VKO86_14495 [Gemmatimonadales bacterium]|nr:hypothetical protein [Gemmatimonadales bacterium]
MSIDWAPAITVSIIALSASAAVALRGPVGKWMELKAAKNGVPMGEVEQLRDRIGSGT